MTAIPALSRLRRASDDVILAERLEPPYTPLRWQGGELSPPTDVYAEVIDTDGQIHRTPIYRTPDPALFRYHAGDDYAAIGGTFARPSAAAYQDLREVGPNVLRDDEQLIEPTTGLPIKTARIEGTSTNIVPYSEAADWTLSDGATAETVSETNPAGGPTCLLLDVSATASARAWRALGAGDTVRTMSLWLRAMPGESGTWRVALTASASGRVDFAVVDHEWRRVVLTREIGSSTDTNVYIAERRSAPPTQLQRVLVWGVQVEDGRGYASSYIRTAGTPVTRATDLLRFDLPAQVAPTRSLAVYQRFIEGGAILTLNARTWQIGGAAFITSRSWQVMRSGPYYRAYIGNSNHQVYSQASAAPPIGAIVEHLSLLEIQGDQGRIRLLQTINSVDSSGPWSDWLDISALIAQGWQAPYLTMGNIDEGTRPGHIALHRHLVIPSLPTLADARRLAGVTAP